MRVVFFIGEFCGGGAERVISILANNMIEEGFEVEILKYHNTSNFYALKKEIKITSVEEHTNTRKNILKNIFWMHQYFSKNVDIIVSFLAPFNILALISNFGNNTPIIVSDRNDPRYVPKNRFRKLLRNVLYNFADKVVVQTKHNREYFSEKIQNKTVVIFNPIDIGNNINLALKTKKEDKIVQVARLEKQKNQEMLIDAFYEVKKERKNLKLFIYGEGNYRKVLEEKIARMNLQNEVILPGNQKDILNLMSTAKVYVCSSNYEGMSNSMIEALCIGLPVITTNVSGAEELIKDGYNGVLINVGDTNQLILSLKKILNNQEFSQKIAENGAHIVNELSSKEICQKWIKLIKETVNE